MAFSSTFHVDLLFFAMAFALERLRSYRFISTAGSKLKCSSDIPSLEAEDEQEIQAVRDWGAERDSGWIGARFKQNSSR
jgi:hypothetical protein